MQSRIHFAKVCLVCLLFAALAQTMYTAPECMAQAPAPSGPAVQAGVQTGRASWTPESTRLFVVGVLKWKSKELEIHWLEIGWDTAGDDVLVPMSNVRKLASKTRPQTNSASTAPKPVLSAGKKVKVLYEGDYYPSTILKVSTDGKFLVHYDGYESSDDEWIDRSRIK
jgi:hypothetical protein